MKKSLLILIIIGCFPGVILSQRNAQWILGYNTVGFPNGFNDLFQIDFLTASPIIKLLDTIAFSSRSTNISMSDTSGNLLFYTNGVAILNSEHDTMINGKYLNPNANTYYYQNGANGIEGVQCVISLPAPDNHNLYYLIHQGYYSDDFSPFPYPLYYCDTLYYSVIDMTEDNGKGAVITKNEHLWVGSLPLRQLASIGSLTACKHANGRDWWVISHRDSSSEFMSFLITPSGILGPYFQNIGPMCLELKGQSVFSPDGSKYAFFQYGYSRINLFDFDRCTGIFSNYVNITNINGYNYGSIGVAFSPNSQYLYTSSFSKIVQWDTYSVNIPNSKVVVAETDTVPCPNYLVNFYLMQLAPNGKIYVSAPSSSHCLSVINYPNLPGLSCDAVPRGFSLPRSNAFAIPNHPNYELGPLIGSPCDSLTGINEFSSSQQQRLKISPNPTSGKFKVSYQSLQNESATLEIVDLFGNRAYHTVLPQWSSVHEVNLNEAITNGMYVCRISNSKRLVVGKVIVDR